MKHESELLNRSEVVRPVVEKDKPYLGWWESTYNWLVIDPYLCHSLSISTGDDSSAEVIDDNSHVSFHVTVAYVMPSYSFIGLSKYA